MAAAKKEVYMAAAKKKKTPPFTVVPLMYYVNAKGDVLTKPKEGYEPQQRGWNLLWPDGSTGIPAGYNVTVEEKADKLLIEAVGTLAWRRGFAGFNTNYGN